MILVDSSVWIDFFNGKATRQTAYLKEHLDDGAFAIGDLMLVEVLQGFKRDKDYRQAKELLLAFPVLDIGGTNTALKAAEAYRKLRAKGITIRGLIDVLLATYCIEHGCALLHLDRDFEPMVRYMGLKSVLTRLH